jgi:predicted O-methyltransferase YrrM
MTYTGDDPEKTRHFVFGMHDRALGIGNALVQMVDLSGRRRMLDVGGGPGTYSALFAQRHPELRAKVLDLPEVVALAGEILASMDGGERVETIAGDYRTTEFPGGNDVVLISGVFHRERRTTCRELIERSRGALAPGGLLIVSDVFTDAGGHAPVFAALFGLNMMLSAPDGGVHADADVAEWMEQAGFRKVTRRPFPPPMPHRVVTGSLE